MSMGQQKDRQGDLMVGWAEMPIVLIVSEDGETAFSALCFTVG